MFKTLPLCFILSRGTTPLILMTCTFILGCDLIPDTDTLSSCVDVCSRVETCDVSPPSLNTDGWGSSDNIPDNDILACGGNCTQDDRARYGYSDCQIECLQTEECNKIAECWKPRTETYQKYCEVNNTPIQPEQMMSEDGTPVEPPVIDNGSVTGSEEIDNLVEDPSINEAIDESDTPINFGENPPSIVGLYRAQGQIDRAENARPVGSEINTQLCFQGTESLSGGTVINYCERGRPGVGRAPIIGEGQDFTVFFELDGVDVTIAFSGSIDESNNVPAAEALVTYTHGQGIWEHSVTQWSQESNECSCPF